LGACRRLRTDALLLFGGALWRPSGPLAQALELTPLGEHQQRHGRDPHERSDRGDRSDLLERARQR